MLYSDYLHYKFYYLARLCIYYSELLLMYLFALVDFSISYVIGFIGTPLLYVFELLTSYSFYDFGNHNIFLSIYSILFLSIFYFIYSIYYSLYNLSISE